MKSFKVLALFTLVATLSCGSPTNVTQATDGSTDGFIKVIKRDTQAGDLLKDEYLNPILRAALAASHRKNAEFTKNFVNGLWDNNRNYNYVACRTATDIKFTGYEGAEWAQKWVAAFDDANYHLFILGKGKFTRKGKGGYGNWAWKGSVENGQDLHNNVVNFVKPGTIGSDIESGGD